MKKLVMIMASCIMIIAMSSTANAKADLGKITITKCTELWHHSGGYWSGTINGFVSDQKVGTLIKNDKASDDFTGAISEMASIAEPFPAELNTFLNNGGNLSEVKTKITYGGGKNADTLFVKGTFSYELNVKTRQITVNFKPYFKLKTDSFYLNFDIPKPHYDSDYIKFAIYHKTTNQLLGVMAAKEWFSYDWIQGLSGNLYHPSNPLVEVSDYGVITRYRLNDLKIGNGTFKDGGAIGYFFTNALVFEFSAPDSEQPPAKPPETQPDKGGPSLNVYFSMTCNGHVATNNPGYPVYVEHYPVPLDLHLDYEVKDNTVTGVTIERQTGDDWTPVTSEKKPLDTYRYNTYRESETFRVTVYSDRMDPISVTASAYTRQMTENGVAFDIDFYLYDKKGRLVNDNYNNPVEVESLPGFLDLFNVVGKEDPNITGVLYRHYGEGKSENLVVNKTGFNDDIPARYMVSGYSMFYLHNMVPPNRMPSHNVFFKIVAPVLKVSATIEGYINRWNGGLDLRGNLLETNGHRFLSLEKVKVKIKTEGHADKVVVRFSSELESMVYRSEGTGHTYDMKKDYGIGYTYFPQDTTFLLDSGKNKNEIGWEYYLPMAKDTLDWENKRVKPPYAMTVYAYKGEKCAVYTIDDIEITGTVHDIIYLQPAG